MTEFLAKLSSYNLFNYLLPGVLFAVIVDKTTDYALIQDNVFVGAFVYYFVGLVISRFGSLVLEPLLRAIRFVRFADYGRFVSASRKDPKIELLSEANNMYRTLCAMFVLALLLKLYSLAEEQWTVLDQWGPHALVVGLLVMFLWSYRKQTNYIVRRIDSSE